MKHVGFKADNETVEALEVLRSTMGLQSGVLPSTSVVIRHYLIEAAKTAKTTKQETREKRRK